MSKLHLPNNPSASDPELNGAGQAALAPLNTSGLQPSYASSLRSDDDEETVDIGQYFKALRRRWPVALGTLLAVIAAGVAYNALQKPIYQSTAVILVSTPGGPDSASDLVSNAIGVSSQSRSLGQQLAIIKSPSIQRGAIKRVKPEEARELNRFARTDIQPEREADAIDVQVQGYDPVAVASFANAICAQYIQQSQEQNRAQVRATTRYVEEQLGLVRGRLDVAELALRKYREQQGSIDLDAESKALLAQVGALEGTARDVAAQRSADEARLAKVDEQMRTLAPSVQTPTVIERSPAVEKLKNQLTDLRLQRVAASRDYKPNSRTIRDIDKQIAAINAQLLTLPQTRPGAWQPNPLRQGFIQQRATLQGQIQASQAQSRDLETSIARARLAASKLPERAYRLGKLTTDQATLQQTYRTLNDKYQTLRIQEEARVPTAYVNTPAEPAGAPISPRKGFNMAMAVLLGLLLAVTAALLVDRLDDRVHADEDVESAANLAILSHIPAIKEAGGQLLTSQTGTSPLLESFRMLRTNIAFAGLDEALRSIVVTSSQPGEGKSTSAANLATVVALGGKTVILVDCDLRRPTVHKLFGLSNSVGFSSVAAGMATLDDAIQATPIEGLFVLASGPIPPNAPELLDSRGGRRVLKAVIDKCDFAVFDCPPALILTDAQIVATAADAVLLVVSANEAHKRDVARTSRLMSQSGAKMLGVLFNKVAERAERYGYYKYGKYANYGGYFDKTENTEPRLNDFSASNGAASRGDASNGVAPNGATPNGASINITRNGDGSNNAALGDGASGDAPSHNGNGAAHNGSGAAHNGASQPISNSLQNGNGHAHDNASSAQTETFIEADIDSRIACKVPPSRPQQ